MDFKLELVPIPVADVDHSKALYAEQYGFKIDLDASGGGGPADNHRRLSARRDCPLHASDWWREVLP